MTELAESTPPALFQTERQREIAATTITTGRVEVAELADRFGVTTETIRRDLSDLQSQQVVRRVHGGAIPWETDDFEPLVSVRGDQHDAEKRRLAKVAVHELPEHGTVIIDSGSTLTRFAEALPHDCGLTVVTNSLPTAQVLADFAHLEVVVIGGTVRKNTLAMVDTLAAASLEPLHVDTLFISSDGMSPEAGLTTPYREEAALKQAMMRAARRVVALVDHSKLGQDHFIRFADWSEVDVLVTNTDVPRDTVEAIEALGTAVLLA